MEKVYIESLDKVGGAENFIIGQKVKISPLASIMRSEIAIILGASKNIDGRICVKGEKSNLIGHYTPTMLEGI